MRYPVSLRKMASFNGSPIQYSLDSEGKELNINSLLDQQLQILFDGCIHCVSCGKSIKKTFAQGFCYDCFINAPENAECIIRPELCRAHLGEGRDPAWEQEHHNRPHYVYLALSSAVKVGVTREDQIPTRWIDQGASSGLILAKCPNRFHAGELEVYLKDYFTDKTNWQRMLKNQIADQSLSDTKNQLCTSIPTPFSNWITSDSTPLALEYPVISYPEKVKSIKLDNYPVFSGILKGIKGQYLLFEGGDVLNVRSHSGYEVIIDTDSNQEKI